MAYIGSSPTKVVSRQSANIFTYTATANQTAFTGSDANGNTLACTPSDIMVHMNGLRLEESDYTASTTTVTLGSGAAAGDEVTITAFVTFESADHYNKSTADTRYVNASGDTMTGALTVDTSTTTNLTVDSANYGGIQLKAAGTDTGYITSYTNGSGTESMYIGGADNVLIHTGTNHALSNGTTRLQIDGSGRVTKPNQPRFRAHKTANTELTTETTIVYNAVTSNVGSHYNTSNGQFTAPVAGLYRFQAFHYHYSSTGGEVRLQLYKNGSLQQNVRHSRSAARSFYDRIVLIEEVELAANDYVYVTGQGSSGGQLHTSAGLGYADFYGHLIG